MARTAFCTAKGLGILVIALVMSALLPPEIKVAGLVFGAAALIALCKSTWPS